VTPPSTTSEVHSPLDMDMRRVKIRKYPISAFAASVRDDYEAKFGEPPAEPGVVRAANLIGHGARGVRGRLRR
jgi:hypothetical protein